MKPSCRAVFVMSMAAALAIGMQPAAAQPKVVADPAGPLELVRASVARVLSIVQAPNAVSSGGGQRRTEIRRVAQGLFDFDEMARLTMAGHWKDRSLREQEEFVRLFLEGKNREPWHRPERYNATVSRVGGLTFLSRRSRS